VTLKIK